MLEIWEKLGSSNAHQLSMWSWVNESEFYRRNTEHFLVVWRVAEKTTHVRITAILTRRQAGERRKPNKCSESVLIFYTVHSRVSECVCTFTCEWYTSPKMYMYAQKLKAKKREQGKDIGGCAVCERRRRIRKRQKSNIYTLYPDILLE